MPEHAEDQPVELERRIAIERAIAALLDACGLDRRHKDFTSTPSRVARVWSQEFLSGFAMDPAKILGDPVEGEGESALVVVRGIPFHGLCPHHLLPYTGTATVAYLPAAKLAGFGRLGDLVACFTRRLTLQERACNDVVDALVEHLGARGAGCVMRGRHTCLSIPDNKHGAEVMTSSVRGELSSRTDLQAQLFA
ncbi:GTP cyclohydrolase I [Nannocystis bainbridge]|uniref:GTP cyclohydrolase I n=1 Tax=Nannocystis bainbridge TaxID=2995303 RepID=A0ABT5DX36_9BACT|nr:GTP cyclohydrolase I [Nannocystis bainbridge]MDC0717710.1 GTP cyclohydrolase I [Nannocystis bainbridge]